MLTSDAPTYISTPTPTPLLTMSSMHNPMDMLPDVRRSQSKSPPTILPFQNLRKLDYLYNAIGVGHMQYAKKLRSHCDEVST